MSISEQVKELRSAAEVHKNNSKYMVNLLNSAADTIEALSEKMRDMCKAGEWIYCADRDNLPEESGKYQTVYDGYEVFAKLNYDRSDGTWYDDGGECHRVIAWWRDYSYEP